MELFVGDKIIYQDVYGGFFTGVIVEVCSSDDQEITGYFVVTDAGLYIHFHASNLEFIHLDESTPVP